MRLSLLLLAAINVAVPASAESAADLVLVHARVYAAPNVAPLARATVVVHYGQIKSVTSEKTNRKGRFPDGATVLDCTGMSVTAGFWNSHVHILPVALLHADRKTDAELTAALQEMLTRWGFTTVFDIASVLANTEEIRNRIEAGKIGGPRILTTGEPFFLPHGVPSYVRDYLEQQQIVLPDDATTVEAVARVRRQVKAGADGIKIFAGSIEGDKVLMMPLERARGIADEAHRLGRPVFAHPSNVAGVEIAVKSGVDVLAHVTSDAVWPDELVREMIAGQMAVVPTLTLFDVEAKHAGASPEEAEKIVNRAVARLRAYSNAGGEVLFGTDVGYIYHFDTEEEFRLMKRAGMTFAQILASLTTNPARRFGFAKRTGRVEAGMDADLTVVAGDPESDLAALSRVRFTIRAGKVIYGGGK